MYIYTLFIIAALSGVPGSTAPTPEPQLDPLTWGDGGTTPVNVGNNFFTNSDTDASTPYNPGVAAVSNNQNGPLLVG